MSERIVEATEPDEVFTLLSNDTRVGILRALWDSPEHELPFSELFAAVDIDDSGQFNYHLDKLVGTFVAETADGYELTQAGVQINGAIHAGIYTLSAEIEPITLPDHCQSCGGEQEFRYEDETVVVSCNSCEIVTRVGVPPGTFAEYDREEMPDVAERYLRSVLYHVTRGFCPICDGSVEPSVAPLRESVPDGELDGPTGDVPWLRYECQQCGSELESGLVAALVFHPAVVSFHYDRDTPLGGGSVWEFVGAGLDPDRARVRDDSSFRAEVRYPADGTELVVVVDETLSVVETERRG